MRTTVGVAALVSVLAFAGCTPDAVAPPPPPPSPVSQSPTETARERQERLDYAAAEKAYRTFRAEYNRVLRAGGAEEPTKVMKATAQGQYLRAFTEVIRAYKSLGNRDTGPERIRYVRYGGYTPDEVVLEVCEDSRGIRTLRPGSKPGRGEVRTAVLRVRHSDDGWRVSSGTGRKVDACA
jgi:hypothetical protein